MWSVLFAVRVPEKNKRQLAVLAAIRFARFFSFQFRTMPRTFYGASERFTKLRMEIIASFSSRDAVRAL